MLEKANTKDSEPKPNVDNEDPREIERITDNIKKRIQGGY